MKSLIMQGVGLTGTAVDSDLGTNRIRAAFHDDNGRPIFMELCGHLVTEFTDEPYKKYGDVCGIIIRAYYVDEENPFKEEENLFSNKNPDEIPKSAALQLIHQENTG